MDFWSRAIRGRAPFRCRPSLQVYELGRLLYWPRLLVTFTTDIPLFLMQLFMVSWARPRPPLCVR